jgi:membrane-associated phospholipid phosphatase
LLHELDLAVLRLARGRRHRPAAQRAVARFSKLGEHALLWLGIGLAGAVCDRARRGRWLGATRRVALAYAVNTAIKLIVRRRRPLLADVPQLTATPTQLSFPSAHATTSFASARLYTRLGLPRRPLYGVAVALAWSRVYLGVHYPSDVVAGALLGRLLAR